MKNIETKQDGPVVLRAERRSAKRVELSCEEIMRLARQRGPKARRPHDAVFKTVEAELVEETGKRLARPHQSDRP